MNSRGRRYPVECVTGGYAVGDAPPAGTRITDVADNAGSGELPVRCTTPTRTVAGYPSFDCHGFVGGSSGSPWLARDRVTGRLMVRGVVGGPHQGGCSEATSIGPATRALIRAAAPGYRPTGAPRSGGDSC